MDRVLVVDDDPAVCELIEDILSEVRMSAVCVRSDHDAYRIIPSLPTIHALVVDINLGQGTTGFDVARFARQVIPDLPVIYVSGEASQESLEAFGVPDSTYVPKPFGVDDFISTLLARIGLRYTE
ncbi:MAG: response regulator [Ignavibacteriales bacterium]